MTNLPEVPTISCPTCEYRYGHAGQPVSHAKGLLTCNVCNSRWRELNHIQHQIDESYTLSQPFMGATTRVQAPDGFNPGPLQTDEKIRHRTGFSVRLVAATCALMLLLAGGSYQVFFSGDLSPQVIIHSSPLTLDNIKVEDHQNNQIPFWIITARITNKTVHSVAVPPILMRSGDKGSSGYFGWMYRPALQKLAPGSNLIIRTSIHRPTGSSKNIEMKFADYNLNSG